MSVCQVSHNGIYIDPNVVGSNPGGAEIKFNLGGGAEIELHVFHKYQEANIESGLV